MSVTLISKKTIGNQQKLIVSLTVDGDTCIYTTVQPETIKGNRLDNPNILDGEILTDQSLQDYLDANENKYKLNILKQMYPNADYSGSSGATEVAKFEAWITAGHTNTEKTGLNMVGFTVVKQKDEIITKVPWTMELPDPLPEFDESLNRGKISEETKNILRETNDVATLKAWLGRIFKISLE